MNKDLEDMFESMALSKARPNIKHIIIPKR